VGFGEGEDGDEQGVDEGAQERQFRLGEQQHTAGPRGEDLKDEAVHLYDKLVEEQEILSRGDAVVDKCKLCVEFDAV
jgi:hypothetical protein